MQFLGEFILHHPDFSADEHNIRDYVSSTKFGRLEMRHESAAIQTGRHGERHGFVLLTMAIAAIALIAARCGDSSYARRASSVERPSNATDETARAASASAAAPGAQRDLSAKTAPRQVQSIDEVAGSYRFAPWPLKLGQR